jgi:hypothetical protein
MINKLMVGVWDENAVLAVKYMKKPTFMSAF